MNKVLHIFLSIIILFLTSCQKKPAPPSLTYGDDNTAYYEDDHFSSSENPYTSNPRETSRKNDDNTTNQNIPQQVHDIWSYSPQTIDIPAQTTMGQAVYNTFPNFRRCYDYSYTGGTKLIGEMSADRAGYNYSFYSYPISLQILSLSQLHLGFVASQYNIICQIILGNIEIDATQIISGYNGMRIEIKVVNKTDSYQNVIFEQGQMIEVAEHHVQNVVLSSKAEAQLTPKGSWSFTLPVFCAAHHRNSPTGYSARLTPYVMNAPSNTFQSQQRIWNVLESDDDPNSYVTFYVWGKGDVTSSGRRSATGHAFVRIPNVGVYGFSTKNGELLNDEGHIYDHTSSIRYATDSCRIKVSEEAIKAMTKKLRQLQQNVPRYKIGRSDCTSFVMDIADAGGIHYGTRITIQTPVGFMQELKKHNYYTY